MATGGFIMKRMMMTVILLSFLILLFFGRSFALTNEEASPLLKEFIKTEFRILEIREAPLEGFWEVVTEIGQERTIIYIHKNLRFIIHGRILDRQMKRDMTRERLKDFRRVEYFRPSPRECHSHGTGETKTLCIYGPSMPFLLPAP